MEQLLPLHYPENNYHKNNNLMKILGIIMKLLIIEDNPLNLKLLSLLSKNLGYDVIFFENGKEALYHIQSDSTKPDLILTDIQMPIMDGFEFIKILRDNGRPNIKNIPVYAVTAMAMDGDKEKIISHGFDGYIAKPINTREVRAQLKEFMENQQVLDTQITTESVKGSY